MLNIVLVEPEIPQNCGNIARTCAATRSRLHLIEPLGFDISEKAVRRAGLDYWPMVDLRVYPDLDHFFDQYPAPDLWLATTKAPRDYTQAVFRDNCFLFFGKETAGLPQWFRQGMEAAMLAPTAMNQQKFQISLEGNRVTARSLGGFYSKVDLGVVKCHFEMGAGKENFTWAS